jgi:predicted deacetylase
MNWRMWDRVEDVLQDLKVHPILAVVPDNRDERLAIDPPKEEFWERVRTWQSRNWTIGVHGYQHRLRAANRGLVGWSDRSEFAGLSLEEQESKLRLAINVFRNNGVEPEVWVAPNHSFDASTLTALRRCGISVISDGHGLRPYRDKQGLIWIPMQMWRFEPRTLGVWTVCHHSNGWTDARFHTFVNDVRAFRDRIVDLPYVVQHYGFRKRGLEDMAYHLQLRVKQQVRRSILRWRSKASNQS